MIFFRWESTLPTKWRRSNNNLEINCCQIAAENSTRDSGERRWLGQGWSRDAEQCSRAEQRTELQPGNVREQKSQRAETGGGLLYLEAILLSFRVINFNPTERFWYTTWQSWDCSLQFLHCANWESLLRLCLLPSALLLSLFPATLSGRCWQLFTETYSEKILLWPGLKRRGGSLKQCWKGENHHFSTETYCKMPEVKSFHFSAGFLKGVI